MPTRARVTMNTDKIRLQVKGATKEAMTALALQGERYTKEQIVSNGQVDTGFMLNTVYSASESASTYGSTQGAGRYTSGRTGGQVKRVKDDEAPLGGADALVAVAADYAIFQELKHSFLYTSIERLASEAGAVIEPVYKSRLGNG